MKLTILLASLLFAATSAKGVYVEGATTDSSGVEAVVAAAKFGGNEAPAANHRRMVSGGKDQTAKLDIDEIPAAYGGRQLKAFKSGPCTTWWCVWWPWRWDDFNL